MAAVLNLSLMETITALEKRPRLDLVVVRLDKAAVSEALVSRPAGKKAPKRKSVFDPFLIEMALHPASLREWGINE